MVISQAEERPIFQGRGWGGEDTIVAPGAPVGPSAPGAPVGPSAPVVPRVSVPVVRGVSSECRRALVLADGLEQVCRSCREYPGVPVLARARVSGNDLARVWLAFERGASLVSVSARAPLARMREVCRIAAGCGGGVLVEIPREGFHRAAARAWREAGVEYVLVTQLEPQDATFPVEVGLGERIDQLAGLGFTVVLAVGNAGEGPHEFVDNPVGLVVAGDLLPLRPPPQTGPPCPPPEVTYSRANCKVLHAFTSSPTVPLLVEEERPVRVGAAFV